MAFKTFTAGETLTASDVNTYLAKQAVIVCTSGTRPASPVEGMTIYETDTDRLACYDGASWAPVAAGYHAVLSGWTVGTAFSALTGSFSLPAGRWFVGAKGVFDFSTTTARTYDVELFNSTASTNLDTSTVSGSGLTIGKIPWSLMAPVTLTASATIQARAKVSAVDGTQLIANGRIWASSVTAIA